MLMVALHIKTLVAKGVAQPQSLHLKIVFVFLFVCGVVIRPAKIVSEHCVTVIVLVCRKAPQVVNLIALLRHKRNNAIGY